MMTQAEATTLLPSRLVSQLPLPGPIPLELELPGCQAQLRPPRPSAPPGRCGEHVFDGDRWIWIEIRDPRQLALCGVLPGARARRDSAGGEPIDWRELDRQLAGLALRVGRDGTWEPGGSASILIGNVRAQTMTMADAGRCGDLRIPEWLRDPAWGLNKSELALVVLLLAAYERGWGGVFDCQSTVASELGMCERQLRRLLNDQTWKRKDGSIGHRPGLVARGLVSALHTWKAPTRAGSGYDHSWLLLRPAGQLERCARWATWAKDWTTAPPRRSGITRLLARRVVSAMRRAARGSRFESAHNAWEKRFRTSLDQVEHLSLPRVEQSGSKGQAWTEGKATELLEHTVAGLAAGHSVPRAIGRESVEGGGEESPRGAEALASLGRSLELGGTGDAEDLEGDRNALPRVEPIEGVGEAVGERMGGGGVGDEMSEHRDGSGHAPEPTPGAHASAAVSAELSRARGLSSAEGRPPVGRPAGPAGAFSRRRADSLSDKSADQGSPYGATPVVLLGVGAGENPRPARAGLPPSNEKAPSPAGPADRPTGGRPSADDNPRARESSADTAAEACAPGHCTARAKPGARRDCLHVRHRRGVCLDCRAVIVAATESELLAELGDPVLAMLVAFQRRTDAD